MAYSDYGALVYKNGERRRDKEDVALFASDEETFGESSLNIPSGVRIFAHLFYKDGKENSWIDHIHHGILGDGDIRVLCHKQGLPEIYERTENGIEKIEYVSEDIDHYDYDPIVFEYKGYTFRFCKECHYLAVMKEPDGTLWQCFYDYRFGAGFEESEEVVE